MSTLKWTIAGALTAATLTAPATASAQAWTRDQGTGYVNASVSTLSGDQLYTRTGDTVEINNYTQTIVGVYGEFGLLDRWLTLSLSSELFRRNELEDVGATEGLGDLQVGLWSGLVESPFRITVGLVVGVPTGDDSPSAGADADDEAQRNARSLPTGDGEVDFTPTLVLGHNFGGETWPLRHYVTGRVGYWARTQGFSDSISYQLELGTQVPVTFLDRFWFTVRLRGVEAFSNDSEGGAAGLGDGVSFTSLSFELYGRVWQGLGAAVGFDTAFAGQNIIAAAPIRFTVSYEF